LNLGQAGKPGLFGGPASPIGLKVETTAATNTRAAMTAITNPIRYDQRSQSIANSLSQREGPE
jgi:hypothetical protein